MSVPFLHLKNAENRAKKNGFQKTLTDFKRKNDENFGFCLFYLGHFSTKERNICLFLVIFSSSENAKKGHSRISEGKMTKISDFVFFIRVIFLQNREISAYFCLYFQIFYVLSPGANATQGPWGKFGLF